MTHKESGKTYYLYLTEEGIDYLLHATDKVAVFQPIKSAMTMLDKNLPDMAWFVVLKFETQKYGSITGMVSTRSAA